MVALALLLAGCAAASERLTAMRAKARVAGTPPGGAVKVYLFPPTAPVTSQQATAAQAAPAAPTTSPTPTTPSALTPAVVWGGAASNDTPPLIGPEAWPLL